MRFSFRSTIALFCSLFMVGAVFASPSQSAENIIDVNQGWVVPDNTTGLGSQNGYFGERSSEDRDYSALLDQAKIGPKAQEDPTCSSLYDPKCSAAQNFIYYAQIPVCNSAIETNCIEAVSAIDTSGKVYPGSFMRYFPDTAQNKFEGSPSANLPSGGGASLFNIPGAEGAAGSTYFVSFIMSGNISKGGSAKLTSVHSRIVPVQLQPKQYSFPWCLSENKLCNTGWNKLNNEGSGYIWNESGSSGIGCADGSVGESLCAQKQAYPKDFRFALKVRLSITPAGWMHGRMTNPEISIEKSGTNTLLTVTANPIGVPTVYKHFMWADMPTKLQNNYDPSSGKYFDRSTGLVINGGEGWSNTISRSTDYSVRAWTTAPSPYSSSAMDELNLWLPYVDNTATVVPQFWSFRSLTQRELQGANKCFTDLTALNGIVTTNATAYSPGPPVYDKDAGDLNYQVAAPHYLPNGADVFKGTYDLVMRSEVARCIYGFSNAPIKASISIVSNDGTPQIATTVVNEKNGWLYLTANNFQFSSPTLKVSLKQDKVIATPAPTPTPSATPSAAATPSPQVIAKKLSITCIKGKTVRKVTGTNPKCPAGFRSK
ncbi:unannotated protein [freshwater metagenome]|uniref:Unannotated protein n=1 Tax=freshwater metagenome TaxID=449393 RepID=A0A6J6RAS7_9ZZZZ|nr:hypothetical protein [Actinomycetota bacterium]MSZ59179.1 hypothetical protein [Actinomycetota bacterium]